MEIPILSLKLRLAQLLTLSTLARKYLLMLQVELRNSRKNTRSNKNILNKVFFKYRSLHDSMKTFLFL